MISIHREYIEQEAHVVHQKEYKHDHFD